jgi:hypothetical protein
MEDGRHGNPRFGGRAGSGGDYQPVRVDRPNSLQVYLVIAKDLDLLSQLAEILHQIIGEGVIIIYHYKHNFLSEQ